MHPLFSTAMSSPGLLLAHASAYAELASVELEEALSWHQRRLQVCALMWLQVGLALVLLSVSFMFEPCGSGCPLRYRSPERWLAACG